MGYKTWAKVIQEGNQEGRYPSVEDEPNGSIASQNREDNKK